MSNPRALVAGHGDFAAGMISAVDQITGRGALLLGMTNRELSAAGVEACMRELLDTHGLSVIFTDLPAGSCTMAARRLQRERPSLVVVCGVNVGGLLDFVFHEDEAAADAAVHAAEKGRASLVVLGGAQRAS